MSGTLVRRIIVKHAISALVVSTLVIAAAPAMAQEAAKQAMGRQIPLRVNVVVSRHQGEKKISSMPYTLSVVANDNDKTSLRMGVDVPIPSTVFGGSSEGGKTSVPMTSFSYRSIGTNIDCSARTIEEGVYKLDLAVQDSSIFIREKDTTGVPNAPAPTVRHFTSTFNLILRDGQTVQHTAATDPVSGEVLRVEVTLNVLK